MTQGFCFLFFPGNYKNELTFGWDSVLKSLSRVGPRENGRGGMASAGRQLFMASCYNKAKGNAATAGGGANLRRNVMTQTVGITAEEAPLNTHEGKELVHSGRLSLSREHGQSAHRGEEG